MEKEEFNSIVKKYNAGKANPEEIRFLEAYYEAFGVRDHFVENSDPNVADQFWNNIKSEIDLRIENRDLEGQHLASDKTYRFWPRFTAAASILLALTLGAYYFLNKNTRYKQIAKSKPHVIAPGRGQATLTLANGKKIILTNSLSGKLAQQGGTAIQVNGNNGIAYVTPKVTIANNLPVTYNTLSTAKGEQSPYPLILSDGTKIWLNAASSVTFPTVFYGKERMVEVKGEAYFEIAHNAAHPFKIAIKGQVIEDIGTKFNINAYDNEPSIKTTLLEGSVRVIKATQTAIVKPGQQAITHMGSNLIAIETADLEETMAWKNGLFVFKKADIYTVMRQLERWYNVEVVYEGKVPQRSFNGDMHKNLNASQVLDVLSYYRVHFRIDGKKIIVKE